MPKSKTKADEFLIHRNISAKQVRNLPDNVKQVTIVWGASIKAVKAIPEHVKRIVIGRNAIAKTIDAIPKHFTSVCIGKDAPSDTVKKIPKHIRLVEISSATSIEAVKALPKHILVALFAADTKVEVLNAIPSHIKRVSELTNGFKKIKKTISKLPAKTSPRTDSPAHPSCRPIFEQIPSGQLPPPNQVYTLSGYPTLSSHALAINNNGAEKDSTNQILNQLLETVQRFGKDLTDFKAILHQKVSNQKNSLTKVQSKVSEIEKKTSTIEDKLKKLEGSKLSNNTGSSKSSLKRKRKKNKAHFIIRNRQKTTNNTPLSLNTRQFSSLSMFSNSNSNTGPINNNDTQLASSPP